MANHEDEAHCVVCCESLEFVAVSLSCKHAVCCSLCSMRMRVLLKETKCVYCKSDVEQVFVTSDRQRDFEGIETWGNVAGPGIEYHEPSATFFDFNADGVKEHMDSLLALQDFACDACPSRKGGPPAGKGGTNNNNKNKKSATQPGRLTFPTFEALNQHLNSKHKLHTCKLCAEFRGQFVMELERFTKDQLAVHNKRGDPKTAFRGHPTCEFCKENFYNDDHLYKHLNECHEKCHICARDPSKRNEYYRDYRNLEKHFRKAHHMCQEQECLDLKFVVFETDIELQGHMATHHPNSRAGRAFHVPVNFHVRRAGYDGSGIFSGGSGRTSSHQQSQETIDTMSFSYNPGDDRASPSGGRGRGGNRRHQQPSFNMEGASLEEASFPSLGNGAGPRSSQAPQQGGRYGIVAGGGGRVEVHDEGHFPSLPSNAPQLSRNARRRANRRQQAENELAADYQGLRLGGGLTLVHRNKQGKKKKKQPQTVAPPQNAQVLNRPSTRDQVYVAPGTQTRPPAPAAEEMKTEESAIQQTAPPAPQASFSARNQKAKTNPTNASAMAELAEVIKSCLHGDENRFNDFQRACGNFARGMIPAEEYYQTISSMFSSKQLNLFFPALVKTLPDKGKANKLQKIHDRAQQAPAPNSKKASGKNKGGKGNNNNAKRTERPKGVGQQQQLQRQSTPPAPQQAPVATPNRTPAPVVTAAPPPQPPQVAATAADDWPAASSSQPSAQQPLRWRSDMAPWVGTAAGSRQRTPQPQQQAAVAAAPPSGAGDFPSLEALKPTGASKRETGTAKERWDKWAKKGKGSKTFVLGAPKKKTSSKW